MQPAEASASPARSGRWRNQHDAIKGKRVAAKEEATADQGGTEKRARVEQALLLRDACLAAYGLGHEKLVEADLEVEEARRERGVARPTRVAAFLAKSSEDRLGGQSASSCSMPVASSPKRSRSARRRIVYKRLLGPWHPPHAHSAAPRRRLAACTAASLVAFGSCVSLYVLFVFLLVALS